MTHKLPCSPDSRKAWAWFLTLTSPLLAGGVLLQKHHTTAQLLLLLTGWSYWTFFEYYLHRFIMHDAKGLTDPAQHAEHHRHHREPSELRVVGWHRAALTIAAIVMLGLSWSHGSWFTLIVGIQLGLVSYAYTHWFLHRPIAQRILPRLSRHHLQHHCARPNSCFGVTVTWWDVILGTGIRQERVVTPAQRNFYFGRSSGSLSLRTTHMALTLFTACQFHVSPQDTVRPKQYTALLVTTGNAAPASINFERTADICCWMHRSRSLAGPEPPTYCPPICEPIPGMSMFPFRDSRKMGRTMANRAPLTQVVGQCMEIGNPAHPMPGSLSNPCPR
jgi:hypothetical protein